MVLISRLLCAAFAAFAVIDDAVAFLAPAASVCRSGAKSTNKLFTQRSNDNDTTSTEAQSSRRNFVNNGVAASLGILATTVVPLGPANASGGATAGGVYLLSAKQRYNKRVLAGIGAFLALDPSDLKQVDAFFATEEEGGWNDFSAAGYLLSNAFRTSSTKPPDSLPSVKKWKAFAKQAEALKKSVAKKDGEKVASSYQSAEESLDAYLDAVELPSVMELKKK